MFKVQESCFLENVIHFHSCGSVKLSGVADGSKEHDRLFHGLPNKLEYIILTSHIFVGPLSYPLPSTLK